MSKDKTFETKFKRRQQGKTNYAKRLAQVKSKKVRVVVRKTNSQIIAHAVKYNPKGDETIASATSKELNQFSFYGTNNTTSAYLTGLLLGKRMKDKDAILDIGRRSPSHGGVVFACLKGLVDAGVNVPHSPEALPSEDRITGKVLASYAKENKDKFKNYEKNKINLDDLVEAVKKAKSEILKVKE
ncbi:MAG: 50S ribosomal protein L18 [Candidatus ainarchaeum sp.]|nr:50S ribosomal protein L18 [Candidatus ainarchaeum sp.]